MSAAQHGLRTVRGMTQRITIGRTRYIVTHAPHAPQVDHARLATQALAAGGVEDDGRPRSVDACADEARDLALTLLGGAAA